MTITYNSMILLNMNILTSERRNEGPLSFSVGECYQQVTCDFSLKSDTLKY